MSTEEKQKIFIINVEATSSAWVANANKISDTLEKLFRTADYDVVTIKGFRELDRLLQSDIRGIVLINAHGEAIPMPESWGDNWKFYLKRIGELTRDLGWTIVSLTGYPFFYYSRGNEVKQTGPDPQEKMNGLGAFISAVDGQVRGAFWQEANLTLEGKTAITEIEDFVPPEKLWVSRCFYWENLSADKVYYSAGPILGAASIPIGKGFLIYNGMLSIDFGTSPNEYSDSILANFAFAFTLDTITRLIIRGRQEYPIKILNEIATDINNRLPSMVQSTPRREKEVQKHVNDILKLKYSDFDFRWEQLEFPYSIKSYKPDFTSEKLSMAIDVKLCNKLGKAKGIVDEINADITAYKTKFKYLIFIVYDTDKYIPDTITFTRDFERHNAGVKVFVVK